jgi:hypothetical protein
VFTRYKWRELAHYLLPSLRPLLVRLLLLVLRTVLNGLVLVLRQAASCLRVLLLLLLLLWRVLRHAWCSREIS